MAPRPTPLPRRPDRSGRGLDRPAPPSVLAKASSLWRTALDFARSGAAATADIFGYRVAHGRARQSPDRWRDPLAIGWTAILRGASAARDRASAEERLFHVFLRLHHPRNTASPASGLANLKRIVARRNGARL